MSLTVDEKIGVPITLTIAALVGFLFFTPASTWFHVEKMDVGDARVWQELEVDFQRTIKRDFEGAWRVQVRKQVEGGWETICTTPWELQDYKKDAVLPIPVTFEWLAWTEPRCYELLPGEYEVEVTWNINPDSLLLNRELRMMDTFTVFGAT